MTTQQHLDWFVSLLSSEFAANWKAWAWDRAKEIAKDPEHKELPRLLTEAMHAKATDTATKVMK